MKSFRLMACIAALAMLAACSDDDAPAAVAAAGGATVTGGVVKGPVLGSTVCAYTLNGGVKAAMVTLSLAAGASGSISGGCYVTPADGSYNFAVPAGTSGDLLIEATGGTFCSNETPIVAGACPGGGTLLSLTGGVMSSVVTVATSGNATVYTTPLTTAAVGAAGAGLSASNFNTQFNALAGTIIGSGSGVTPGTAPNAANQPYLTQVATYLAGGGTLTSAVTALKQGTTTFPPPGSSSGSATVTGTINPALVAAMQTMKFYVDGGPGCGSFCSYTDMQNVAVQIFNDSSISIAGTVYTGAFVHNYGAGPHLPEISWYDAALDIEYALSDNQGGTFSEINVYKGRQPGSQFLGQIRIPVAPGGALSAIAGTYNKAQQYAGPSGEVAWTSLTIGADGVVTFTGGAGPTLSSVSTTAVFSNGLGASIVRIYSSVDINGAGGVTDDDQIAFYLDSTNHVKDVEYFVGPSNVSGNKRGVTLRKLGEAAPATLGSPGESTTDIASNQITGTVLGTPLALTVNLFSGMVDSGFQLSASGTNQSWQIRVLNAVQVNTNYSCVHGARDGRSISVQTNASTTRSSQEGGNCNIYITELGMSGNTITSIKGRFTAEVFTFSRNQSVVITDGTFNWAQ